MGILSWGFGAAVAIVTTIKSHAIFPFVLFAFCQNTFWMLWLDDCVQTTGYLPFNWCDNTSCTDTSSESLSIFMIRIVDHPTGIRTIKISIMYKEMKLNECVIESYFVQNFKNEIQPTIARQLLLWNINTCWYVWVNFWITCGKRNIFSWACSISMLARPICSKPIQVQLLHWNKTSRALVVGGRCYRLWARLLVYGWRVMSLCE